MDENLISFKGSKDGLYIYVKEGSFQAIKEQLDLILKKSGDFFKGGKVINIKGRKLTKDEKKELEEIIEGKYGISLNEPENLVENDSENINSVTESEFFEGIEEGNTKFIRATIRSGQRIKYEGNIVILGDVNPGAEILANGNIIVMGSLRGIAHAGVDGNKKAIVSAFSLQPTQLRIGKIIARCPDNEILPARRPEIAIVKENAVIIEPYLPKK